MYGMNVKIISHFHVIFNVNNTLPVPSVTLVLRMTDGFSHAILT